MSTCCLFIIIFLKNINKINNNIHHHYISLKYHQIFSKTYLLKFKFELKDRVIIILRLIYLFFFIMSKELKG
jgi:hypothetical protein